MMQPGYTQSLQSVFGAFSQLRGQTLHTKDPEFNQLMERLGERLNLAPHMVREHRIVGPADIGTWARV